MDFPIGILSAVPPTPTFRSRPPLQAIQPLLGPRPNATTGNECGATAPLGGQNAQITGADTARTGNNLASAPRIYIVQAGDSYAGIAKTVWGDASLGSRIADANGIPESALQPGQILTLPAAESVGAGSTCCDKGSASE